MQISIFVKSTRDFFGRPIYELDRFIDLAIKHLDQPSTWIDVDEEEAGDRLRADWIRQSTKIQRATRDHALKVAEALPKANYKLEEIAKIPEAKGLHETLTAYTDRPEIIKKIVDQTIELSRSEAEQATESLKIFELLQSKLKTVIHKYRATLNSDKGRHTITTHAATKNAAISNIMQAKECPAVAISRVTKIYN